MDVATPFASPLSKRRTSHREHCDNPAGLQMRGTAGKGFTTSTQRGGEGRKQKEGRVHVQRQETDEELGLLGTVAGVCPVQERRPG